ncbi:MAG: hypothetical protein JNK10_11425 [Cyclobacteriaceae bacterium]|nr:hypothetical protein [Cyclobacteriaceae bacterium]
MRTLFILTTFLLACAVPLSSTALPEQGPSEVPGNCTFTMKGTVDGISFDVTITVTNVNAIECAFMKAAARKAMEPPKK